MKEWVEQDEDNCYQNGDFMEEYYDINADGDNNMDFVCDIKAPVLTVNILRFVFNSQKSQNKYQVHLFIPALNGIF